MDIHIPTSDEYKYRSTKGTAKDIKIGFKDGKSHCVRRITFGKLKKDINNYSHNLTIIAQINSKERAVANAILRNTTDCQTVWFPEVICASNFVIRVNEEKALQYVVPFYRLFGPLNEIDF